MTSLLLFCHPKTWISFLVWRQMMASRIVLQEFQRTPKPVSGTTVMTQMPTRPAPKSQAVKWSSLTRISSFDHRSNSRKSHQDVTRANSPALELAAFSAMMTQAQISKKLKMRKCRFWASRWWKFAVEFQRTRKTSVPPPESPSPTKLWWSETNTAVKLPCLFDLPMGFFMISKAP